MAAPQPTNEAFNTRFTSTYPMGGNPAARNSRVQVERARTSKTTRTKVPARQVAQTAADIATMMNKANQDESWQRSRMKAGSRVIHTIDRTLGSMESYDDWDEDIDSLEDVAAAVKKQGLLRTSVHALLEIRAKIKASRALRIIAIFAWGAIILQFIFAIVNIFAAGVAYTISESGQAISYSTVAVAGGPIGGAAIATDIFFDGAISETAGQVASGVAEATGNIAQEIEDATGVPVGDFFNLASPQFWFEISTFMIWSLGIGLMLLTALIFFFSGINPFWGKHMTPKTVAFCVGIVGYAFPLLNLVPWFLVYAIVVWLHPR